MIDADAGDSWAYPLNAEERAAVATLRGSLADPVRAFEWWEQIVARLLAGEVTDQGCGWDVEVPYGDDVVRVEVKYATETRMLFQSGRREVFRFVGLRGHGRTVKAADVVVLLGLDTDERVWAWVIPAALVPRGPAVTMTSPRVRIGAGRSGLDRWRVPFDQLLPEVLRAYRYNQVPAP